MGAMPVRKSKRRDHILIQETVHSELWRNLGCTSEVLNSAGRTFWSRSTCKERSRMTLSAKNFPSIIWHYVKKKKKKRKPNWTIRCFVYISGWNSLFLKVSLLPQICPINHLSHGFSHAFPSWAHPFLWGLLTQSLDLVDLLDKIQPEKKQSKNLAFNLQLTEC